MFAIGIKTDNAAFVPDSMPEVVRVLRQLADRYEDRGYIDDVLIMDVNGNRIGRASYTED